MPVGVCSLRLPEAENASLAVVAVSTHAESKPILILAVLEEDARDSDVDSRLRGNDRTGAAECCREFDGVSRATYFKSQVRNPNWGVQRGEAPLRSFLSPQGWGIKGG